MLVQNPVAQRAGLDVFMSWRAPLQILFLFTQVVFQDFFNDPVVVISDLVSPPTSLRPGVMHLYFFADQFIRNTVVMLILT